MYSTPTNHRSTGTINPTSSVSLKLTPSPFPRGPKSPNKPRGAFDVGLSLKRIIGTTVSSPNGFDSVSTANIFAYTAGAAAVVISVADDGSTSQRFYRARPTAIPSPVPTSTPGPSTPMNPSDGRSRSVVSLKETSSPHPSTPTAWTVDWSDSPSNKTWTSRERIKAATCLSISRDAKFIAVGETGYSPRVLIFSLQDHSSDIPLEILSDHTFGVRAVAFSPNQKFLASLGTANDGFLYIWTFDKKTGSCKLHSSNRCTSAIKGMAWIGNLRLVTVGTRHVKIWKVETNAPTSPSKQRFLSDFGPQPVTASPSGRTLPGRNCLLGPLSDTTFTAIAPISDGHAIVCTEKGDVCLLVDSDGASKISKELSAGFGITSAAVDADGRTLRVGGRNKRTKVFNIDAVMARSGEESGSRHEDVVSPTSGLGSICATGCVAGFWVDVDTRHAMTAYAQDSTPATPVSMDGTDRRRLDLDNLASHNEAVQGVEILPQPNAAGAAFFTYDSCGTVLFWNLDGCKVDSIQIPLEQPSNADDEWTNTCTKVQASKTAEYFVTGDRSGVLRVLDLATREFVFSTKAHGSEILDIAIYEEDTKFLLASCGRDRTAQLYRRISGQFVLVQTMDEHTASVSGIMFVENGEKIVTSSADRTVHIRHIMTKELGGQEIMAAISARIITLKATPVSMTLSTENSLMMLVSAMDRTVATYEIATGRLTSSFRAVDQDSNDAVVMDSLVMGKANNPLGRPLVLAGVSSTDKSIRVYDGSTGLFVDREWGHTSSITDVAILETADADKSTLISTASDGTIMIWELGTRQGEDTTDPANEDGESPSKETTFARQPLRRVLSKADLAEFQRPSPTVTPTGRCSPPRPLRRKTSSRFSLAVSSKPLPSLPTVNASQQFSPAEEAGFLRSGSRNRSPSPPSPRTRRDMRRPSLASLSDARGRNKSTGPRSEFGSLNMATEQVCRTLRAYRKKMKSSEAVKEDLLNELDRELRLTVEALGEKTLQIKDISDTVLTGLLDQYSDRLVSMLDQKLRMSFSLNTNDDGHSATPTINDSSDGNPGATDSSSDKDTC